MSIFFVVVYKRAKRDKKLEDQDRGQREEAWEKKPVRAGNWTRGCSEAEEFVNLKHIFFRAEIKCRNPEAQHAFTISTYLRNSVRKGMVHFPLRSVLTSVLNSKDKKQSFRLKIWR